MGLLVDQSVVVTIDGGVHTKGEDVLVMRSQDTRVHDGTPRYFDPLIDRLRTNDTSGPYLVSDLTRLIEDERHDIFVIGNGDDGLHNKLATSHDRSPTGPIVGMLPPNAGVLLVDAAHLLHE